MRTSPPISVIFLGGGGEGIPNSSARIWHAQWSDLASYCMTATTEIHAPSGRIVQPFLQMKSQQGVIYSTVDRISAQSSLSFSCFNSYISVLYDRLPPQEAYSNKDGMPNHNNSVLPNAVHIMLDLVATDSQSPSSWHTAKPGGHQEVVSGGWFRKKHMQLGADCWGSLRVGGYSAISVSVENN